MKNKIIDDSVAVDFSAKQVHNNKNNNDTHLITTITTVQQLNELAHTHSLQFLNFLASYGFVLLPIKPATSTKDLQPYITFDNGTADRQQIKTWFATYEGCWWGVLTGERSGITVIDVDRHNSQDGFKTLEKKGLSVASTLRQKTPHDGIHYIFKYNPIVPNKNGIDVGIDIRNDNGFILVAPTTKDNGNTYEFLDFICARDALTEIPEAFLQTYFSRNVHNAQKKRYKQVQLSQESAPPCVGFLITNGVPQDVEYNAANLILATSCKTSKLSEEVALKLSEQMAKRTSQDHGTQKKTIDAKYSNFKSVYAAVLKDDKYDFNCGHVRGFPSLKTVCEKSDCEFKDFYPQFSQPFFVLRLLESYGDVIRYCPQLGWLWFDGKCWKVQSKNKVKKLLVKTINKLKNLVKPTDAQNAEVKRIAKEEEKSVDDIVKGHKDYNKKLFKGVTSGLNNSNLKAVIELAESWDSIVIDFSQLDKNSYLINCPNGTLNLKTGQLQQHNKDDYITKITKVNYVESATHELFTAYLKQRLPDEGTVQFVQKFFGYCLTDDTDEELLAFFYGDSLTGKSTLATSFYILLGDYARIIPRSLLFQGSIDKKLQLIADLWKIRFALCDEVNEKDTFDESTTKSMVSGEPQKARLLYQEPFDVMPTWKVCIIGNTFPNVKDSSGATWRRLGIVPFEKPLAENEVNKEFKKAFKNDKKAQEAIFAWTVEGCFKWLREGIKPPAKVQLEKVNQKLAKNPIVDFVVRRLEIIEADTEREENPLHYKLVDEYCSFADIYKAYELDCSSRKERFNVPKNVFGRYLKELGFDYAPNSTTRVHYYDHVRIAESEAGNTPYMMYMINSLFRICLEKKCTIINSIDKLENGILSYTSYTGNSDEIKPKEEDKSPLQIDVVDKSKNENQKVLNFEEKLSSTFIIVNEDNCEEILQELAQTEAIGLDCETTGLHVLHNKVRLVQIAADDNAYIFDLFTCNLSVKTALSKILASPVLKIGHNLTFDAKFLKRTGFNVAGPFFDTFLAHKLIYSKDKAGLNSLTQKYLKITLDKDFQTIDWSSNVTAPMLNYAAKDSLVLPQLYAKLLPLLERTGLLETAQLEFELLPVVADMELTGIRIDVEKWDRIIEDVTRQLQRARNELKEEFKDYTINFDSPQQVKLALNKFGISTESVDQKVLQKYVSDYPIVRKYLQYKALSKLRSSFSKSFLEKVNKADSRIRPQYHQLGTETGRFSASDPNVQQVPKNEIRTCFIAGPGNKIIRADYSQIELRILAEVTKDKRLVAAFVNGKDIHTTTAAAVLRKPLETVTDNERQQAKAMNFGLIYGAGVDTFRHSALNYGVSLTLEEATKLRNGFFAAYPSVRQWQQQQGQRIETRTLGGRLRRWRKEDGAPRYNELLNSPIQGTGADILKRALVGIYETFNGTDKIKIIGMVHDEVLIEVAESEAETVKGQVERIMKEAGQYYLRTVPIEVDMSISDTWGGNVIGRKDNSGVQKHEIIHHSHASVSTDFSEEVESEV